MLLLLATLLLFVEYGIFLMGSFRPLTQTILHDFLVRASAGPPTTDQKIQSRRPSNDCNKTHCSYNVSLIRGVGNGAECTGRRDSAGRHARQLGISDSRR